MEKPQKLPSGRWRARIFKDGRKVSLGTYDTKKLAEEAQAQALVNKEEDIRGRVKFWRYAETQLQVNKDRWTAGTWENNVRNYRNHLQPTFGEKRLCDISNALVKRWWVSMADKPGPRRAAYMVLSGIMSAAEEDGEISRWVGVRGSSKDVSTPRPVLEVDTLNLLRMLNGDRLTGMVLTVLVNSGLRIGEVLALDWEDFDANQGTLHVYKHLTRFGIEPGRKKHPDADILQPLPKAAVDALSAHQAADKGIGPMFLNRAGERLSYHAWYARWDTLRKDFHMEHIRTHDIRSTHLTEFGKSASMAETMERGGHKDYRSAMRYQRPSFERQKEIVSQLNF